VLCGEFVPKGEDVVCGFGNSMLKDIMMMLI